MKLTHTKIAEIFSNVDRFDRWCLNEEVQDKYELLCYVISRGNVERALKVAEEIGLEPGERIR